MQIFTADIYWTNHMEYTAHMWLQVHQRPLTIIIWKWVETQTSVNMDKATTTFPNTRHHGLLPVSF